MDLNKLSRDYQKQPLKKNEKLSYDELHYLFIELNLSSSIIGGLVGRNGQTILNWCSKYNLNKTKEQIIEARCNTVEQKYRVRYASQNKELLEKAKNTYRNRTGYDHPMKNPQVKNKVIQTRSSNPDLISQSIEKQKKTNQERYGVDFYTQSNEFKTKALTTIKNKYGENINNVMEVDEIKLKREATCINRYNCSYPCQNPIIKAKSTAKQNETNLKILKTKKKNKSFGKSKLEDKLFNILISKYPDAIHSYQDDRYFNQETKVPYICDYYIPSLDLFIELNAYISHGQLPYDPSNPICIKQLDKWNQKIETFKNHYPNSHKSCKYIEYIKNWTIRDVDKINCAKRNNLNYLVFYNEKEFMSWFNSLGDM